MISSNSRIDGAAIGLSTTVSFSPSTTNSVPGSSPSRLRIASGMTTWPFEESLVVAISSMIKNPTGKTI